MKNSKTIAIVCIIAVIIIGVSLGIIAGLKSVKNDETPEIEKEETTKIQTEEKKPEIIINIEDTEEEPEEDELTKIENTDIYYVFGEDVIYVKDYVKNWVSISGNEIYFDEEAVKEFVRSLAKKYDTFGISRQFKTHDGEEITVKGGTYGWWMDRQSEIDGLIAALKNGEQGQRTPEYYSTAAQYGKNDIGNTYIEADLTKQHLWVYEEGVVVEEADFVSGNISKGFGTHTGTYGITYKERNATLAGQGYSSPVAYWMPFNENEGLHDAKWRNEFGGEIYLRDGSHGCLNLPPEKAAAIYERVYKNEPVIVYGGKTEVPALTPEEQIALLIQAGLINPDGTPIEGITPSTEGDIPAPVENEVPAPPAEGQE